MTSDSETKLARIRMLLPTLESADPFAIYEDLKPIHRKVAKLSALGMSNTDIARELGLDPKTADNYAYNVAKKLGIGGKADYPAEVFRMIERILNDEPLKGGDTD